MRISVVIPTKNRASEVERLLRHLTEQSCKPNEVIVVDDSKNSETRKIIERFRDFYSKKGIDLKHAWDSESSSRAKLIGGLMCKGENIVYIDDDLAVRKDSIEMLMETLSKTGAMAVWARIYFEDSHRFWLSRVFELLYYRFLFGKSTYGGGFFAIRRKVLEDKVWFDQNLSGYALGEDKDFASNVYRRYGPERIIQIEYPVLATNRGTLVKDRKYYAYLFGNTLYFSKKWGGTIRLLQAFWLTLVLCGFNIVSQGGRGVSSISKLKILRSYLDTLRNCRYFLTGNLDYAYE
jgi:glycosyltransferase involved in cell wall biosynthesis